MKPLIENPCILTKRNELVFSEHLVKHHYSLVCLILKLNIQKITKKPGCNYR